jgi:hypothetical protein
MTRIARRCLDSSEKLGRHRWVTERTLAWLNRFRHLAIRSERRADIHEAFVIFRDAFICLNQIKRFSRCFLETQLIGEQSAISLCSR